MSNTAVEDINMIRCCTLQALTGVKCLQHVMHLLGNAGPVLRLEGGLRALLVVLQSSLESPEVLKPCLHLLTQLSTGSAVASATVVDSGALPLLMRGLDHTSTEEPLLSATVQLLVVLSKPPKGAAKLCELQLVPAVAGVLSAHESSAAICGAALKLLRRVAKQPACREPLLAAGAVQLLLSTAYKMAALEGQQQLVKRACRALWLLCPGSLTPLPPQEPCWPVPSRSSFQLNLADAMGNDVQRLQELFPELQAAFVANQAAGTATGASSALMPPVNPVSDASSSVQQLPKLGRQAPGVPPSVEGLMQQSNVEKEPFHPDNNHLVTKCMLHDLQRLQDPSNLMNQVVFDSIQPLPVSLQQHGNDSIGAAPPAKPPMPRTAAPAAMGDAPLGLLQFASNFEGANLRLAVLVREAEYDLFLSNDLNDRSSSGNSAQWFYFGVWNAQPGQTYKLNVVNFIKPESLYTACKQPLMCCAHPNSAAYQAVQNPLGLGCETAALQQHHAAGCDTQTNCAGEVITGADTSVADISKQPLQLSPKAACLDAYQGGSSCSTSHHAGTCSAVSRWHRVGQNVCYYASPYRGRPASNTHERGSIAGSSGSSSSSSSSKKLKGARAKSPKKKSAAGANSSKHGSHSHRRTTAEAATPVAYPVAAGATTAVQEDSSSGEATSRLTGSSQQPGEHCGPPMALAATAAGPGLYCLTFEVSFPCSGIYLICNCYPYTYSDLQQQLARIQLRYSKLLPAQVPVVRSLLCYTLGGQRCDMLTVTDFSSSAAELASREYVVITARVHPGETCGSWIMQVRCATSIVQGKLNTMQDSCLHVWPYTWCTLQTSVCC
eukprot:GHUV01047153.1.p1 GENE.GHUV01047153.1~~GHUV01047153.1.p1  ORF type:complete len:834 (+),score=202.53 GHUV01047153.1:825-3326(+)